MGVRTNSIPINSEKIQTELNSPKCIEVKIQTFQLTSNDPTSIIENTISLELDLYCSNHYRKNCRCTVAATVAPDVLHTLGWSGEEEGVDLGLHETGARHCYSIMLCVLPDAASWGRWEGEEREKKMKKRKMLLIKQFW
jgi:hypothetical protein